LTSKEAWNIWWEENLFLPWQQYFEFQILGNAVNPSINSDNDRLKKQMKLILDLPWPQEPTKASKHETWEH
jgi:hypothetical protein